MGEAALWTLAFALSAVFGGLGVLTGIGIGVRSVKRDEERYGVVALQCESVQGDQHRLRIEWGNTLENLEQLAASIEKGRRRIAASESAASRRLPDQEPERALSVSEQRDEIRRRMRRVV